MIIFDWEKFTQEDIAVFFKSTEEIYDFLENAKIRGFRFYNKRSKGLNFVGAWKDDNTLGLFSTNNKRLLRTNCAVNENDVYWTDCMVKVEKKTQSKLPKIYTLKDFEEEKIVINCQNRWQAENLLKTLHLRGWTWNSRDSLLNFTRCSEYQKYTYYRANKRKKGIVYGNVHGSGTDYNVVKYEEVLI